MKNNFPTEADDDEPEIMRKLDELHAHNRKVHEAEMRRAWFLFSLICVVSVSSGWFLRALIFS